MSVRINRIVLSDADDGLKKPLVIKPLTNPVIPYKGFSSRGTFESSEYDLGEINVAEDVDSYIRQAHRRKKGLGFKEGWDLVGKDPTTLSYTKKRFAQLEVAQSKPWRILLKELFYDLISKSNAYLVKVRNLDASGGHRRKEGVRDIDPIAAYFIAAPETIEIKRNDSGKITKYRQVLPSGERKEFTPDNVAHFTIDKKTGFTFGTPILTPVLEDIRALRRIEENIDLLVYQNLFPLFQYKVGTETQPAQTYPDGTTEIDLVRSELEFMPPEGMLVTPERHEVQMIGSEGRALRAEGYLKHFKERVFAGMGMSSVDFGEGSVSRASANTLSDNIRDDVKSLQDDFEAQIDFFIIRELLLEGKFDSDPLDDESIVRLVFREVDLEAKIAWENHIAQMYMQHLYSEDEARVAIGKDTIPEEDETIRPKMFWNLIEQPKLLITAVDEAYLASAAVNDPNTALEEEDVKEGEKLLETENKRQARLKSISPNRGQRSGASRNRPSNQRGTRTGPKVRDQIVDNLISSSFDELLNDIKIYKEKDVSNNWIEHVIRAWTTSVSNKFSRTVKRDFYDGTRGAGVDPFLYDLNAQVRTIEERSSYYIHKLANNLSDRLKRLDGTESSNSEIMSVVDITSNRVNAIYESERRKAYNYGVLTAFKIRGIEQFKYDTLPDACETCLEKVKTTMSVKNTTIDDLAPHHPWCSCKLIKS